MKLNKQTKIPLVYELFSELKINYVKGWPALSPDLNPIEKCWNLSQIELDKLLIETKPRNKQQLFALVKRSWELVDFFFQVKSIKFYLALKVKHKYILILRSLVKTLFA